MSTVHRLSTRDHLFTPSASSSAPPAKPKPPRPSASSGPRTVRGSRTKPQPVVVIPDRDNTDDPCTDVEALENIPAPTAATQEAVEDQLLAIIMLDHALSRLPAPFRALIELLYAYRAAPGYDGIWPPTAQDVGRYLGDRFDHGHPIPVRTVWRWHAAVLAHWSHSRGTRDTANAFATLGLFVPPRLTLQRAA